MPIGVANADKRPILAEQETVERGDQDLHPPDTEPRVGGPGKPLYIVPPEPPSSGRRAAYHLIHRLFDSFLF